jgi:soluble lytic murein transglycosylase
MVCKHPPQFAIGKLFDAETNLQGKNWKASDRKDPIVAKALSTIRTAFRSGELSTEQQSYVMKNYGTILKQSDYFEAVDALYWSRDLRQADKLLSKLNTKQRKFFDARKRLIRSSNGVDSALRRVAKELKTHPGLMYDRLYWRHKRKLRGGSIAILKQAPNSIPHPYLWWKIRKYYVWDAIEKKRYRNAYNLLKNHGQTEGEGFAEAEWLSGWLNYRYPQNPSRAYEHFFKLYHGVKYPISKARGAYWAGRAAQNMVRM